MKLSALYEGKDILSKDMLRFAKEASELIVNGLENHSIVLSNDVTGVAADIVGDKKGNVKIIDLFVVQEESNYGPSSIGGTSHADPEAHKKETAQILVKIPAEPESWSSNEARTNLTRSIRHVILHELVHCFDIRFEQDHLYNKRETLHQYVDLLSRIRELKKAGKRDTPELDQLIGSYARSVTEQDAYLASLASSILDKMFNRGLNKEQIKRKISKFDFKKYLTYDTMLDWNNFKDHPRFRKMLGKALYSHLNRIY